MCIIYIHISIIIYIYCVNIDLPHLQNPKYSVGHWKKTPSLEGTKCFRPFKGLTYRHWQHTELTSNGQDSIKALTSIRQTQAMAYHYFMAFTLCWFHQRETVVATQFIDLRTDVKVFVISVAWRNNEEGRERRTFVQKKMYSWHKPWCTTSTGLIAWNSPPILKEMIQLQWNSGYFLPSQ